MLIAAGTRTWRETEMSKFSDAKFKTASDNIANHAKEECKVDIEG